MAPEIDVTGQRVEEKTDTEKSWNPMDCVSDGEATALWKLSMFII